MSDNYLRIAAIIIQNEKLLMVQGAGYEELWTPGGKPELNESDEDCLKRELAEEIGVTLIGAKYFGNYTGSSPYEANRLSTNKVYICTVSGDPKPNNEIAKVIWLSKLDYNQNVYKMIPLDKNNLLPDIIKAKIF